MDDRRRRVLIDAPVQLRLVGLIVASGILTVLLGIGYAWLNWRLISVTLTNANVSTEPAANLLWYYGALSLGGFIVLMSIMVFVTLLVTNRIVGPLYRLRVELTRMLDEEEIDDLISVRDDDYIDEFVRELNRFILTAKRNNQGKLKAGEGPLADIQPLDGTEARKHLRDEPS